MHYKNGRPAQVGDWVIGKTHNSERKLRVGFVKRLTPEKGTCNVELLVPRFTNSDFLGGVHEFIPYQPNGCITDYAYTAELIHILDGYRAASICADAFNWDSLSNPAPEIDKI